MGFFINQKPMKNLNEIEEKLVKLRKIFQEITLKDSSKIELRDNIFLKIINVEENIKLSKEYWFDSLYSKEKLAIALNLEIATIEKYCITN